VGLGVGAVRGNQPGGPPRHRSLRTIAALVIAGATASCSTPAGGAAKDVKSATASASPAAAPGSVTPAPEGSPLPFPKVAPVAATAGWTPGTSPHWVGYTFSAHGVSGVRAEWTEPTVHGGARSEEFVWIGVGGWGPRQSNLIQAGTFAYFPPYGTNEGIWYQRIPPDRRAKFPLVSVNPGDRIYASVTRLPGPGSKWRLSVDDVTVASAYAITLKFHSQEAYPSFIVEDPNRDSSGPSGPFYRIPRWKSVTFSNMQVRVGGKWAAAATLPAIRITMNRNGRVLAVAGPLSRRSGFSATQR
jgi:peptidase A4-like protein